MKTIHMFQAECALVDALEIGMLEKGALHHLAFRLVHDGIGRAVYLPVMVARGMEDGPVFGITAAVHGNELNGIPVIQRLFRELDPKKIKGTVIGVVVVNVPAYLSHQRGFKEGTDLNRVMPGRSDGNSAEVYAHRLLTRLINRFDYLIDLHTASFGRINSLYVRANLHHPVANEIARLQRPEIIVHNEAPDGSLRAAAMSLGIPAVTIEVGNPNRFQKGLIEDSLEGLRNVLSTFGVLPDPADITDLPDPIICSRSYWVYAQHGGVLEVFPAQTDPIRKGEVIARVGNVFGTMVGEYESPEDGVVVGRSTNPVCETGARIVHIGIPGAPRPSTPVPALPRQSSSS